MTVKYSLVSSETIRLYEKYSMEAEAAYKLLEAGLSRYWWSLYEIYSKRLWEAYFETLDDWIGDMARQAWGPSRSAFFSRMGAIQTWFRLGLGEEEVKVLLGSPKVAIEHDIRKWLYKEDNEVRVLPEVAERIEAEGKTPAQVIMEANDLGPAEARKRIMSFLVKDEIYPLDDFSLSQDRLEMRLMYETHKAGVVGDYKIVVVFPKGVPDAVRNYVARRLLGKLAGV